MTPPTGRPRLLLLAAAVVLVLVAGTVAVLLRPGSGSGSPGGTAAPAPSASPVPSPGGSPGPLTTPSPQARDCIDAPSRCGYPDATNTGVPEGTPLVQVPSKVRSGRGWVWDPRGWVSVTKNGTVIDGLEVQGTIIVEASGVTVRNTRVRQTGEKFGIALQHARNATVQDSEVLGHDDGPGRLMVGIKDIYGDSQGTRVLRNDIYHTSTAVQIYAGLIQDNFLHDPGFIQGDHINGITDNGGITRPLVIRHNTVLIPMPQTDAISLFQDFGAQANRTIEHNLIAGGAYTLYAGGDGKEPTSQIKVRDNRWSRRYFPQGGRYGPVTAFEPQGAGNEFSGNVWDDTGEPVRSR